MDELSTLVGEETLESFRTVAFHATLLATGLAMFIPLFIWSFYARRSPLIDTVLSLRDLAVFSLFRRPPRAEYLERVITAEELRARVEDTVVKARPVVIDCRPVEEYFAGHIDGAVLLPFQDFRSQFEATLVERSVTKETPIVVTCFIGKYSCVAVDLLRRAGYSNVLDFEKGMEHWKNECKYPVVHGLIQTLTMTSSVSSSPKGRVLSKKSGPVYMDNQATTRLDPRVLEAMMPFLEDSFGNAASRSHVYGSQAALSVLQARQRIAIAIGAPTENGEPSDEICFTSGATESNNLAIKGMWEYARKHSPEKNHIITCVTEHKAVLDTCKYLEAEHGAKVTYLPVLENDGRIDIQVLEEAMTPQTLFVTIMIANNEIGVIHPFREIGELCRARNIWFHSDGTQGVGKVHPPVDVVADKIDLLSLSGHKIYGPKGVGALYVNPGVQLDMQMHGGGHESGRRSGTLNVPGIVGLGLACELACAKEHARDETVRLQNLRDSLLSQITTGLGASSEDANKQRVNGSMDHRIPGNLHMSFKGIDAEAFLVELAQDVALSSGSACTSNKKDEPSHVLVGLQVPEAYLKCPVRFGLGRFTTQEEVHFVADRVVTAVKQLRDRV